MLKLIKVIEEIEVQENESFNEVYLRSGNENNVWKSEISVEELPFHHMLQDDWDAIREAVQVTGNKHFALIKYELCSYSYHKNVDCELIDELRTIGSTWKPLD